MAFISFFIHFFSLFIHKHLIKMISKVCIPNCASKKCFDRISTPRSKHRHNLRNKHYFLCTLKDKCEFVRIFILFHLQQWCLILGVCVKIFEYWEWRRLIRFYPKAINTFYFGYDPIKIFLLYDLIVVKRHIYNRKEESNVGLIDILWLE